MSLMLPPRVESAFAPRKPVVNEPLAPKSETYTVGQVDEFQQLMGDVRSMLTTAIGTLKEVKAQVREKPGARFLIGEILSCLGSAQKATRINLSQLNFNTI